MLPSNRSPLAALFLAAFFLPATGLAQAPSSSNTQGRPNIIFILADDLGYSDISPYGSEVQTPTLQRLASEGMRFTQMHNTSKCFPSRACLLTGIYSQQASMHDSPGHFENCVNFGEVLRRVGYRTLFVGKHHSTDNPHDHGFDHYWGLRDGAANYFNRGLQRPGEPMPGQKRYGKRVFAFDDKIVQPFTPEADYYATDAWTDWSIELLEKYRQEDKPFLLYLAYQAPHDPLQALPEDIKKYEGVYNDGYEAIRKARYQRQLESGLIDSKAWPLSEATHDAWDSLPERTRQDEIRKMQVYAAMIDRLDQNIGRLLDYLRSAGKLENTLVMFASDNGASAENVRKGEGEIGSMTRWSSLGGNWANVGNTPLRLFKNDSYQGGICTPFIAWWPGKIQAGSKNDDACHFIDIMPTLMEIAGAEYPTKYQGSPVIPLQGKSLLPAFGGKSIERSEPLYWQWSRGQAIYRDGYKLVTRDRGTTWQLYHLPTDRTETTDLAGKKPELVAALKHAYDAWWASTESSRN